MKNNPKKSKQLSKDYDEVILELLRFYTARLAKKPLGAFARKTIRFQEEQRVELLGWVQTIDWQVPAQKFVKDTTKVTFVYTVGELKEMIKDKEDEDLIEFKEKVRFERYATYPKAPINKLTEELGPWKRWQKVSEVYKWDKS